MVLKNNPEFAYELILTIPYAYWLHETGQLEKIITSKDMAPFYYFCNNVEEVYTHRTIDNSTSGIALLPNTWPHHNCLSVLGKTYDLCTKEEQDSVNGVLDYSKWSPPPFKDYYSATDLNIEMALGNNKYVIVNNIYNIGGHASRFFDIDTLYEIFNYLTKLGYTVIYKRPNNTEFVTDQLETKNAELWHHYSATSKFTDFDMCNWFNGKVIDINELKKQYPNLSYNAFQLKLFSGADSFITVNGGGAVLCAYFGKPVIIYAPEGKELRPNYLSGKNSYIKRLANSEIFPIFSTREDGMKFGFDTEKIMHTVKQVIK